MIESGEDPMFIARRLVILASEDVGLADPHALPLAVAAQQAVHFVGHARGFYPLAQAALYLATAPKSNAVGRPTAARPTCEALAQRPGAAAPAQRADRADEGPRLRRGLPVRPRTTPTWTPRAICRRPSRCNRTCPRRWANGPTSSPAKQGDEARLRAWIDAPPRQHRPRRERAVRRRVTRSAAALGRPQRWTRTVPARPKSTGVDNIYQCDVCCPHTLLTCSRLWTAGFSR